MMRICTLEKADFDFIFSAAVLAAAKAAEDNSELTVSCSIASISTHCSSLECFNQMSNNLETRKRRRRLYFNLKHSTISAYKHQHNKTQYGMN